MNDNTTEKTITTDPLETPKPLDGWWFLQHGIAGHIRACGPAGEDWSAIYMGADRLVWHRGANLLTETDRPPLPAAVVSAALSRFHHVFTLPYAKREEYCSHRTWLGVYVGG